MGPEVGTMGLFGRRSREPREGEQDPAVPFLSVHDAAEVRRLAQRAFAEAGVDVVVHPDHFAATDGRMYGLWNVAATCRAAPGGRREWPELVQRHVRALLAPTPAPDELSDGELLAGVVLRVYGADALPLDAGFLTYVRPIADDLVEALVLDLPESVLVLRDEDVARFDLDELRHVGLEHLLREPVDAVETLAPKGGGAFQVVLGDSVYTASRVLAMRDLLARVHGDRAYPDGVLVCVPYRHQVAVHALDGPDAVPAVNAMAAFAKAGYDDGVGGVSPHLYWWRDGALTRVSRVADGGIVIEVDAELAEVLGRLTGRAEGADG